jgi:hypothetical protein
MNFSFSRAFRFAVLTGVAMLVVETGLSAQSTSANGNTGPVQIPRLCMPVSYRQDFPEIPPRTKVTMRGDRYIGVNEAISGWNEAGVPLVGLHDGKWEPVPCGDDTGLFYIVPLLSRATDWNTLKSLELFLLGVLAVASLAGLVALWMDADGVQQRMLACIPIFAGTFASYKAGDVYLIQGSAVLISTPWLIYCLRKDLRERYRLLICFATGIILGAAQWTRSQSGLAVLVLFTVLLLFHHLRPIKKIRLLMALLLGMSLPLLYSQIPLHQRDKFLATRNPAYQRSLNHHLLWHTVYVGLSYLKNPYVSSWHDAVGTEYVERINPAVIYGGEQYDNLLKARVKEIALGDPRFIFYTVTAKLGVMLSVLLACLNVGLLAAVLRPKAMGTELAFWLAFATAALPGIIAIPDPQYAIGMVTLSFFYWYYSMRFYLANPRKRTGEAHLIEERSRPHLQHQTSNGVTRP